MSIRVCVCVAMFGAGAAWAHPGHQLDLTHAVLLTPAEQSPREARAADMLLDEVERRTKVRWEEVHAWPSGEAPVVVLGDVARVGKLLEGKGEALAPPAKAESYALGVDAQHRVQVIGQDERGVLFGAGRLLRELRMEPGLALLDSAVSVETAPETSLRGHQLGYRPKTNSYDAWTPEMWEQYIRDLAVFGTNAIELIPPRSDDAETSPHFPLPQIEMMKRMSQICDDYGLDVWVWYPALDKDYSDPATVAAALAEWEGVLKQVPRVDALFVPGGDPGHTEPLLMMNLLEKQTENLRKIHPKLQMWMSPQGFNKEWMDTFLAYMQREQPKWMSGIVFGPQNRLLLGDLREALPEQYPIRHYPDITHTIMCQFPVPDWDLAYALTENREPINPRPTQYAHIFRIYNPLTIGFITYSEGCNDDVNKIVWSSLGWQMGMPVETILQEYARYFIGPRFEEAFSAGLLMLERNWSGPRAELGGVMETLDAFKQMEARALASEKDNWRFQQALYRAYYDAYTILRRGQESTQQEIALSVLGRSERLGSKEAIRQARKALAMAETQKVNPEIRGRVFELAEALWQSIRMQLSVEKYQAIGTERGANLDLIDNPLNDRVWLESRFAEIEKLEGEDARVAALMEIAHWTDPGEGGFYDDFGDPTQQPHLVRSATPYVDPEFKTEPNMGRDWEKHFRTAWNQFADTRYEMDLQARYEGLDPNASYTLRVVYAGDNMERKMRLVAEGAEVHGFIAKPNPPERLTFEIPKSATADGVLELTWSQEPGTRGGGRGCQVAEVWLAPSKQ